MAQEKHHGYLDKRADIKHHTSTEEGWSGIPLGILFILMMFLAILITSSHHS